MTADNQERNAGSSPADGIEDVQGATLDDTSAIQSPNAGEEPAQRQETEDPPPAVPKGRDDSIESATTTAPTPAEVAEKSVDALFERAAEVAGEERDERPAKGREKKPDAETDSEEEPRRTTEKTEREDKPADEVRISDKIWKSLPSEAKSAIIELRKRDSAAKQRETVAQAGEELVGFLVEHQIAEDFQHTPHQDLALAVKAMGALRRAQAGQKAAQDDQVINAFRERIGSHAKPALPVSAKELRDLVAKAHLDADETSFARLNEIMAKLEDAEKAGNTPAAATDTGQAQGTPTNGAIRNEVNTRQDKVREAIYAGKTRDFMVANGIKADPKTIVQHVQANVLPVAVELLAKRLPQGINPWAAITALDAADRYQLVAEAHQTWAARAAARKAPEGKTRPVTGGQRRPLAQAAVGGRHVPAPVRTSSTSSKEQAAASVAALCGEE